MDLPPTACHQHRHGNRQYRDCRHQRRRPRCVTHRRRHPGGRYDQRRHDGSRRLQIGRAGGGRTLRVHAGARQRDRRQRRSLVSALRTRLRAGPDVRRMRGPEAPCPAPPTRFRQPRHHISARRFRSMRRCRSRRRSTAEASSTRCTSAWAGTPSCSAPATTAATTARPTAPGAALIGHYGHRDGDPVASMAADQSSTTASARCRPASTSTAARARTAAATTPASMPRLAMARSTSSTICSAASSRAARTSSMPGASAATGRISARATGISTASLQATWYDDATSTRDAVGLRDGETRRLGPRRLAGGRLSVRPRRWLADRAAGAAGLPDDQPQRLQRRRGRRALQRHRFAGRPHRRRLARTSGGRGDGPSRQAGPSCATAWGCVDIWHEFLGQPTT